MTVGVLQDQPSRCAPYHRQQQKASPRRLLVKLLVLCFFLRALVPAGFMPDLSAARDGVITITICTAYGISTISLDENGDPIDPEETPEQQSGDLCRFASAGSIDLPEPPREVTASGFVLYAALQSPRDTITHGRRIAGPLGPRAPPTNS